MADKNHLYPHLGGGTAIWYVLYSGVADHITVGTWVADGLVAGEGLLLLLFRNHCPLTLLARKYSVSQAANFDIFLPNWLARYNKLLFTDCSIWRPCC